MFSLLAPSTGLGAWEVGMGALVSEALAWSFFGRLQGLFTHRLSGAKVGLRNRCTQSAVVAEVSALPNDTRNAAGSIPNKRPASINLLTVSRPSGLAPSMVKTSCLGFIAESSILLLYFSFSGFHVTSTNSENRTWVVKDTPWLTFMSKLTSMKTRGKST